VTKVDLIAGGPCSVAHPSEHWRDEDKSGSILRVMSKVYAHLADIGKYGCVQNGLSRNLENSTPDAVNSNFNFLASA
jgi:hypothetical protein